MVYCPKCGTRNNEKARFCINCGQPLVPPRKQRSLGRKLLVALLVLVVVAAIAGGTYYLMRQPGSGGQWIAYQTMAPDDTLSLWVVRPDGQDQIQLVNGVDRIGYTQVSTGDQKYKYSPFSPKDRRVVFTGQKWGEQTLYTYALGEAKAKPIVQGVDNIVYRFSPEGSRVGVATWNEAEGSLYLVDADGENRIALLTGADGMQSWNWLPNSSLMVVSPYDRGRSLFVIGADGKHQRTLAEQVEDVRWIPPPEGDRIAYAIKERGLWEVYAAEADGAEPIRLAGGLADVHLCQLSPDGQRLIVKTSSDGYSYDLYLVETDGTGRVTLASDMQDAYGRFIPGGKQIMYQVKQDGLWSLYLAVADGGDQNPVARKANRLTSTLTPNGRTLVLGLQKGGKWDVLAVGVVTGEQVNLLSNADGLGSLIALDNKRVLLSVMEGYDWRLYVARLDGQGTDVLAGPADEFKGYDASPDGRKIAYSEVKLGVSRLYVVNADGSKREKLADDGFSPIWSE